MFTARVMSDPHGEATLALGFGRDQRNAEGTFTLPSQQHSATDVVTVTTTIGHATGYLALHR